MSKTQSIASWCAIMFILTGCTTSTMVNESAPRPSTKPHLMDTEIKDLSQQLVDAHVRLANVRQVKIDSVQQAGKNANDLQATKFSGLDKKRNFKCHCDLKTAMQSLAINLGWDHEKVVELGHKPAQGVPVSINQKNQPLSLVLEQIDVQVGHFVDIRLDPNYESILIEYTALDAPRRPHNAQ